MSITWKLSAVTVVMCCMKWTHKLNLFSLSQSNQSGLESIPSGETRQHFDVASHPGKSLTLTSLLISSLPVTKIWNKKVTWFISCLHDEFLCSKPFEDTLHWQSIFRYVKSLLQSWLHSNPWRTWYWVKSLPQRYLRVFLYVNYVFYYERR